MISTSSSQARSALRSSSSPTRVRTPLRASACATCGHAPCIGVLVFGFRVFSRPCSRSGANETSFSLLEAALAL
jgi:hypothetical protein